MKFFYLFLYFFLFFFIFSQKCIAWQLDCQLSQGVCQAASKTFWQQNTTEPEELLLHFDQLLPANCQLWLAIQSQTELSEWQKNFLAESRLALIDREIILGQANAADLLAGEQLLLGEVPQQYFLHLRWFFPAQKLTETAEWQYQLRWRFSCADQEFANSLPIVASKTAQPSGQDQPSPVADTQEQKSVSSESTAGLTWIKEHLFLVFAGLLSFLFCFALLQWKRLRKKKNF